jgi:DSF synthase
MSTIRYSSEISFQNFKHLEVQVDPEQRSVWLYLNSQPRACFTVALLDELKKFQSILKHNEGKLSYQGQLVDIEFSVFTSRHPVFSFGGDLELFISCIENNDRETLRDYARLCIDGLYANHIGRDLDITTISLIHGNALGGGFECALSGHVLMYVVKTFWTKSGIN